MSATTIRVLNRRSLGETLQAALAGVPPSAQELRSLLTLQDPADIALVAAAARLARERHFGTKLFLYGFVYFSTYCRNHCSFCYYRKANSVSPRYRKERAEVVAVARGLAESGVHLIDLTMGEDPLLHDSGEYGPLLELIEAVKEATGLPVMISPGVVPEGTVRAFGALGVEWYALYQETHTPALFKRLRPGQSFEERAAARAAALEAGMLVEDGMLLGVGESADDRIRALIEMKRTGMAQTRVMSFVPQADTPMAGLREPDRVSEYLCIAVMRLLMPDRLIPASLDVDGIRGLRMRLNAGANVVTSLIPPQSSLAGVSQSTLDIEQGLRTVREVERVAAAEGLRPAPAEEYRQWVSDRKQRQAKEESPR